MSVWRAFVGEHGRSVIDQVGTWDEGRDVLLEFAREAAEDNCGGCEFCLTGATEAVRELTDLEPGTSWEGSIDRDDMELTVAGPVG